MVITRSPRMTLSIDPETMEVFTRLQKFTKLSPAQAIQKLLPQHFGELIDYLTWLEGLDLKDGSVKSQLGPFLMHSIGPDTLPQAMKKLDPTYQTAAEKLATKGK
jgi:hypothetical protein